MVETAGFEPAAPCVQTRISADSRQITKRRQSAHLRVPPAFFSAIAFRWLALSYGGFRSFTLVAARGRHEGTSERLSISTEAVALGPPEAADSWSASRPEQILRAPQVDLSGVYWADE